MVAGDEELEGGIKVEEVLPHEAGSDFVAASERFDLRFIPSPALLCFLCHDEASAAQLGEVGRVALAAGGDEGAHVGNRRVGAEYRRDGVDEGALAVGSGPMSEKKFVLARDACGGIPAVAFEERAQLGVGGDAL